MAAFFLPASFSFFLPGFFLFFLIIAHTNAVNLAMMNQLVFKKGSKHDNYYRPRD